MIIVNLKGGLGNQMFQYALGRSLSIKNNDTLKLDIAGLDSSSRADAQRALRINHFNIKASLASPEEADRLRNPRGILSRTEHLIRRKLLRQFHIGYEPKRLKQKGDVYLDGYFQSEKYFKEYRDTLLKDFTPKNPPSETFKSFKDMITTNTSVSVHIRRGDYASDLKTRLIWSVVESEYYTKALSYLENRIGEYTLFVFSNDIEWVQQNMTFIQKTHYISSSNLKDYEEMLLMKACDHNIIANSTFSWWGAWLNDNPDKIVVAPRKWTRRHSRAHKDIIPSSWIRM